MALTVIPPTDIDKIEFKELVIDLLEDFVHGDASPFKDVKSVLEDYLDGATDLDASQKAGIFSDWLKTAYTDINKQSMSTALELLKLNASLELERYGAEADYNLKVAQEEKVRAEIDVLLQDDLLKAEQVKLVAQQVINEKVKYMEGMGKVEKQYGYADAGLDATLDLAMGESTDDGALDKKIDGYDKLNRKDIRKTMDEKAALMQNAKVPETLDEKKARVELIAEISTAEGGALAYDIVDGVDTHRYTPNTDSIPFNGSWTIL